MDRRFKKNTLTFMMSLILAFFSHRNFIMSPGYIYLAENFEVYTIQDFLKVFSSTWNEKLQVFNLGDLPKLYLYAPLSFFADIFNSYKLLQIILLVLPVLIAFLSTFKLSEYTTRRFVKQRTSERILYLSSLIAAFVFTVNPWFTSMPRNAMLRFQYAFFPLVLYLFIKILESKNIRSVIYFAGVMALLGGYRYSFLVTLMLALVFLSYVLFSKKDDWKEHISKLGRVSFAYLLFGLFSIAKFLPGILYSLFAPTQQLEEFILNKIRRESLLHIFTTKIYEGPGPRFDMTYNDMTHFLFIFIFIFAFTYLIYKRPWERKNYFYLIFPILLFVMFIPLTAKEINVDSLLLTLPSSTFFLKLLRHARWNIIPIIVSMSIMTGYSISLLLSKFKKRSAYPVLILIIFFTSISAWPMFTGDMNGYYRPAEVPKDYILINDNYLAVEQDAVHSLWLPVFSTHKAVWAAASTPLDVGAPMGPFALRSSYLPTYHYSKIYFFDYYNPIGWRPSHRPLDGYKGDDWGDILGPLNIKYLIIHNDVDWRENEVSIGYTNERIKNITENLKNDETLNLIYKGTYITAFEVKNVEPRIKVSNLALVHGGLPIHASLTRITKAASIIYSDSTMLTEETISNAKYILAGSLEGVLEQLQLVLTSNKILLQPSGFIDRDVKPEIKWSYYPDVSSFSFQDNLKKKGVERWSWNLDNGAGLVSTWASNTTINMPFSIENADNYKIFIRYLKNQGGGAIKVLLDNEPKHINTTDQLNTFVWRELGTFYLEKGKHEIVLENTNGFNAVNLFALVPQGEPTKTEESVEDLIRDKRVIYILEAESDMYSDNSPISDKYSGEASNGEVRELLTEASRVWNEIEILRPGNYTIVVKGKGSLNFTLDEKEYAINSTKLDWTYLDRINLEKGKHKLEITYRISSYLAQWGFENSEFLEWHSTKPTVQTLNLDEKAYDGKYSLKGELNASTPRWVAIQSPLIAVTSENRYVWDLQVAGENAHDVHIKMIEYDINKNPIVGKRVKDIGDGNFTWNSINIDYTPSENASYMALQIRHGRETDKPLPNKIWVDDVKLYESHPSDLDVIWIYSTQKENENLEDIFEPKEKTVDIIDYQKIDATKYTVRVNATEPFMLSFSEAYDPLWAAYMEGEKVNPIPLYSVINGFWINKTGETTITIEYEPQKWFYYGSAISITTLIGSVAYLTWDWKEKSYNGSALQKVILWLRK